MSLLHIYDNQTAYCRKNAVNVLKNRKNTIFAANVDPVDNGQKL